ncbi:damage-inducible protein DinB [Gammaproteobacteria bacterium 50_400_T64]|nr:damage-inducible protein DinB [Gammaproteobacteria bacterium 50_400_T64]
MGHHGLKKHFELMAEYNQWMNTSLFSALLGLETLEIAKDRGAFFGSILGTLNHILVGDIIWLKRFTGHPANFTALQSLDELALPASLSEIIHADIAPLKTARENIDSVITHFIKEMQEKDFAYNLTYTNTTGKTFKKQFGHLVQHLFNHQTHHRGQVSTLLNQQGIDIGSTDLLMLIPET